MDALLEHPAVQAAGIPLVAALIVATPLVRTRFAWLALVAAYAAMVSVTTGFSFVPLSAGRKVMLLVLLAPLAGLALDAAGARARAAAAAVCLAAGASVAWVFWTVLAQKSAGDAVLAGAGLAIFVAVLVALALRLRDDGVAAGAAGVGLGLAVGVGALLSASTGFFNAGTSLAAGAGALLLVQVATGRPRVPGWTGVVPLGVAAALFAAASATIAQLPWTALALLPLVPAVASLPVNPNLAVLPRAALLTVLSVAAAAAPIAAAWYATRGPSG